MPKPDLQAELPAGACAGLQGPWIPRQALHAWRLTVRHPDTRTPVTLSAPPPEDFCAAAERLGLSVRDALAGAAAAGGPAAAAAGAAGQR